MPSSSSSKSSTSSTSDAGREIFSGTVAGILSRIFVHPIDTVKSRLQVQSSSSSSSKNKKKPSSSRKQHYKGAFDCFAKIVRHEGVRPLFSGMSYPVGGAAFENAAVFFVYGQTSGFLLKNDTFKNFFGLTKEYRQTLNEIEARQKPLSIVCCAGLAGGIAAGTVLTPSELLKTRAQIDPEKYPNFSESMKTTIRDHKKRHGQGALRALFVGWNSMVLREGPGAAVYFLVYEWILRNVFMKRKNQQTGKREMLIKRDEVSILGLCVSGGLGGVASWGCLFPMDQIRARIQAPDSAIPKRRRAHEVGAAAKQLFKEGGLKIFWKGFGPAAVRAFFSNAIIFGSFEKVSERYDRYFDRKEDEQALFRLRC